MILIIKITILYCIVFFFKIEALKNNFSTTTADNFNAVSIFTKFEHKPVELQILPSSEQNEFKGNNEKDKTRMIRNAFFSKQNSSEKYAIRSKEKPEIRKSENPIRPRFTLSSRTSSIHFKPENYICIEKETNDCINKTNLFRNKVIHELKRVNSEKIDEPNLYNVDYNPNTKKMTSSICSIFLSNVRGLRKKDMSKYPISQFIPKRKLFGRKNKQQSSSCVVVSSGGGLLNSRLGKFIDLHDIVMRFNNAPIEGYENDVGRKTTIRIVNSQVVSKLEFNFLKSPIFQNISMCAWDSGKFNGSLEDWLLSPDFDLFTNYQKFMINQPNANFYLIDPRSIWKLWQALQDHNSIVIRRNPPSSGFIGIALLFPACKYIDVIEYIPSTRLNGKCHYYSEELNTACTFGGWHPLAAEKLMSFDMNSADDFTVFQKGIIRINIPTKDECSTLNFH